MDMINIYFNNTFFLKQLFGGSNITLLMVQSENSTVQ